MAHQLLHRVDGYIFCQQQYAESVAGDVEGDGLLYSGLPTPPFQHLVRLLIRLFPKDILAVAFLTTK